MFDFFPFIKLCLLKKWCWWSALSTPFAWTGGQRRQLGLGVPCGLRKQRDLPSPGALLYLTRPPRWRQSFLALRRAARRPSCTKPRRSPVCWIGWKAGAQLLDLSDTSTSKVRSVLQQSSWQHQTSGILACGRKFESVPDHDKIIPLR